MKKYLLDTNICIYFIKGKFDLHKKIKATGEENCFLSEVTVAELKFGVENSIHQENHRKINKHLQQNLSLFPFLILCKRKSPTENQRQHVG